MNHLAHLYLADGSAESLLGHMLGDFVKGRLDGSYPRPIALAIRAHRQVDVFTDGHPIVRRSRRRFTGRTRRFAGIIVDVCYDHFLCRHWARFSSVELDAFIARAYGTLCDHREILPPRLQQILPLMIERNWLQTNCNIEGVAKTLDRVASRIRRPHPLAQAIEEVKLGYAGLERDFLCFMPRAVAFVERGYVAPAPHWSTSVA